jgi:hypothetical protein
MEDTDAPASARIAAARTSLELAGDIGKHSQSQRNYDCRTSISDVPKYSLNSLIEYLYSLLMWTSFYIINLNDSLLSDLTMNQGN